MNIFGQGLNTLGNWDNQNGRTGVDAFRGLNTGTSVSAGTVGNGSAISSLQPGQVFPGEILNITSQDVTILLDNQQMIHAKLGESMELNIGQRMYFEVKENQGEQIFLRPVQNLNVNGQSMAAEKALSANGFAFTERNLQIANLLMEAGMPLDKDSMRKIMQQSMQMPDADLKQLVAMNRLGIPVNEVNARQFAQYTNHEHQLTQAMNQVIDSVEHIINNVSQTGDIGQLQEMNHQIMNIFGWTGKESVSGEFNNEVQAEPLPVNPTGNEGVLEGTVQNSQSEASNGTAIKSGTVELSILDSLRAQLQEMGIESETVQQITEGQPEYGELLSNISKYLEQESILPEQTLRGFYQSENFRKLLKKGIQEEWLMKPEFMKNPKEIDQLYEKIYKQSAQLEESFNSAGGSGQQFSGQSQNMRENIQFIQQLNQQFIFAQLPMKMNGQEANSELFVYANKKKIQQKEDGVKVLLHLDMPHLGGTDILVRLRDHMLHATFTLEDQTSVSVIADNMTELSQKLEEKGFHFTNEVRKTEPKPEERQKEIQSDTAVEEMLNQDLVTGMKRYTFDMRT